MVGVDRRACPECGELVEVHEGFPHWCECGWNLIPPRVSAGRAERVSLAVAKRLDRRLGRTVAASDLAPQLTAAKSAAFAISGLVYLAAIGLFVGGIALAVATLSLLGIFIGLGLAILGFVMRPRLGKIPPDPQVDRQNAPMLHGLIDEIAAALHTKPIDVLIIDQDFNASWSVVGLRRKRVLRLGLPLLMALDPQERVAVIAHELAHARNGDAARSFLVGGALQALEELFTSLRSGAGTLGYSDFRILEWVSRGLLWILSQPIAGLYYTLALLLLRDSHRAEYLADALAARVAGTAAEIGSDEKLLLSSLFETAALHAGRSDSRGVFEDLSRLMRDVPARERERRRRLARIEGVRLSSTHPPTARRMELLETRPSEPGRVFLDPDRAAAIDRELDPLRASIAASVADDYRAALYGLT